MFFDAVASAVRCKVVVGVGGLPDELHLRPRLALEVEHLLAPIVDVDERITLVVLRHFLVLLDGNAEVEDPRADL
jgi:hypothetical protein